MPISQSEKELFQKNIRYMWAKLSTSHYHVLRSKRTPEHIVGEEYLPSYAICSKCFHNDSYTPSMGVVDAFAKFYSKNLNPPVDSYQLLHEDLSATDSTRYRTTDIIDKRLLGSYWGYYPSGSSDQQIVGAYLKIYQADKILKAALVMGLRNDEDLFHPDLAAVFETDPPGYDEYQQYKKSRSIPSQRCTYYEGLVEITRSSMLITFKSPDEDRRKLILTLNLQSFPFGAERPYYGGMAFALSTSDGPFDARFFRMGLINQTAGEVSLASKGIKEQLRLAGGERSAILTSAVDRRWYELILKLIPGIGQQHKYE